MARKTAPTSTRLIPSKQQYLYDLLVADIRLGRHPPGSPLPSEWDLVALYGVSRTTVRGALAKMTAAGLVQTQQGHATLVHALALQRLADTATEDRSVAVILPGDRLQNPIFIGIMAAFKAHLPTHVRPIMFLHNQIKPDLYVKANAAIMDGSLGPQAIAAVRARMPHVIVINRQTKGFVFACTDNVAGGEIMVNHALSCGHRRLGVIHYGEIDTEEEFIDRLNGLRSACAKAGVQPVEVAVNTYKPQDFTSAQAVDRLLHLDPDITVILCLTDVLALEVLEALNERKISVPNQMALIGFDDLPSSSLTVPALTTVRQPLEELGEALATGVVAIINGRRLELRAPIRPRLMARESCVVLTHTADG